MVLLRGLLSNGHKTRGQGDEDGGEVELRYIGASAGAKTG